MAVPRSLAVAGGYWLPWVFFIFPDRLSCYFAIEKPCGKRNESEQLRKMQKKKEKRELAALVTASFLLSLAYPCWATFDSTPFSTIANLDPPT